MTYLTLAAVLAACGHAAPPPTEPHNASGSSTTEVAIRCQPHGNIVAIGPTADDVPILALYERDAWLSGFDVVTLVVWADGNIVYRDAALRGSHQLFQAQMPKDDVLAIQTSAISKLREAPAHTSLVHATDQPSVQIIFRDGDVFRSVDIYGLTRKTPEGEVPEPMRGVLAEYHELLARRPATRVPAANSGQRPKGWPEELPTYRGQTVIDRLAMCAYDGS